MTMTDRYVDLLKQGFMRGRKVKRVAKPKPIVTCDKCRDWHRQGEHIQAVR
jgi:hypothetical protein